MMKKYSYMSVLGVLGLSLCSGTVLGRGSIDIGGGELEYSGFLRNDSRFGITDHNEELQQSIFRLQIEASWKRYDFGFFDEFSINTVIRPEFDTRMHSRDDQVSYLGKPLTYGNDPLGHSGFDFAFGSPTSGLLSTGGLAKNVTQGVWSANRLSQFEVIAHDAGNFPLIVPLSDHPLNCEGCVTVDDDLLDLAYGRGDTFDEYPFRELFIDAIVGDWWLRLGKQQVVWGKTDFFRLQDIVNPIDFGQHFFYDPFEDIRIPQWAASLQYKAGDIGPLKETAATVVWNFDKFEPVGLGAPGQAWAHPFGKEIGTFVAFNTYFSPEPCVSAATAAAAGAPGTTVCTPGDGRLPSGFGIPVGVNKMDIPDYKISNTEIGGRFEFKLGQVRFALSHYYHWTDNPVFEITSINLNTLATGVPLATANDNLVFGLVEGAFLGGAPGSPAQTPITVIEPNAGVALVAANGAGATQAAAQAALAADNASLFYRTGTVAGAQYSIVYEQVNTTGLSFDYFHDKSGIVFRAESSYTFDELVNNTYKANWVDTSDVFRFSLGMDRPTFIKALNPNRTFFLSAQLFNTHYMDYEGDDDSGFVPGRNNYILTMFAQTQYMRDRLIPNAFYVYEEGSKSHVFGTSVQFLFNNHWSVKGGAHLIWGGDDNQTFDVGPFSSFAGAGTTPNAFSQQAVFGFAKEGIGALRDNDEIYLQVQYQF